MKSSRISSNIMIALFFTSKLFFLANLPVLLGGCNLLEWPAYVVFGRRHTKVKAEYTGLKKQKTALIIATGPGVDFEYPSARTNVALASAQMISRHVKGVQFVEQEKIEAFQMENLDWATLPMNEIARMFGVTRILYLDLYQFTMQEEHSVNLLRGRIRAAVRIYEIDGVRPNQAVYRREVAIVWPEHGPEPMSDSTLARLKMQSIISFADQLSRKFYDHKVPAK